MLCCFGGSSSSSSRKHQRNNAQTVSKIDPLVLPREPRAIDIDIAPDLPLPPAAVVSTSRRPPSPTDPILPGARSSPTYPPSVSGPRIVQVHRPRTADGRSSRRPSSPLTSSSSNTRSRTTHTPITTPESAAAPGRVLRGHSRDEKRGARRQASTPQLRHARTDSASDARAPTTVSAPSRINMSHARSYSNLGPAPAPALPSIVPTSPLLGPADWLPHSRSHLDLAQPVAASPIIRPSAVPIVVHRVTVPAHTPHIDLLSGTVLRPGQDPPPRYEAG